jgi:putative transposase
VPERLLEVCIHGELRKLGIAVAQSTVARYLPRPRKPPCQTLRTFLTNHLAETAAIDFFTVPTATFRIFCSRTIGVVYCTSG